MLFSPHGFISLSDEPFSLAKVVQIGATPINKLRSGRNYHGSLPQIAHNLGIPEISRRISWLSPLGVCYFDTSKEKDSKRYEVDDD